MHFPKCKLKNTLKVVLKNPETLHKHVCMPLSYLIVSNVFGIFLAIASVDILIL